VIVLVSSISYFFTEDRAEKHKALEIARLWGRDRDHPMEGTENTVVGTF